jgi:ribosome-binding protein aMBF1 (putative translation factor)
MAACWHDVAGPCWWVDVDLCSHCLLLMDMEDEAMRHNDTIQDAAAGLRTQIQRLYAESEEVQAFARLTDALRLLTGSESVLDAWDEAPAADAPTPRQAKPKAKPKAKRKAKRTKAPAADAGAAVDVDCKDLAKRVKAYREEHGLSINALSDQTGVSWGTLRAIENGHAKPGHGKGREAIARVLAAIDNGSAGADAADEVEI